MPTRARQPFRMALDVTTLLVLVWAAATFVLRSERHAPPLSEAGRTASLPPDSIAGVLELVTPDGSARALQGEVGKAGALILVFRTDCRFCDAQKAEWLRLASLASNGGASVLAITPEALTAEVAGYFDTAAVSVFSLAAPAEVVAALGVTVVPTTVLVRSGGRIAFHHSGLLDDNTVQALTAALAAAGAP